MKPAYLVNLELTPYSEVLMFQKSFQRMCIEKLIPDTLILTEHTPVITIGKSGGWDHLKATPEDICRKDIAIFESDRGGSVTFHGPGQLVAYPIFNLCLCNNDILHYLRLLEEVIIQLLERYSISGRRFPPHTGVWVDYNKIAAIGVSCRQSVSMHGLALNVDIDLNYFSLINPCGIIDHGVTSMVEERDNEIKMDQIRTDLRDIFSTVFNLSFCDMPSEMIDQLLAGFDKTPVVNI
jgi:lipoyl(octanoyl) transferase